MLTHKQAKEILLALQKLPPEKVAQVYEYITFLRERYGESSSVDVSEAWSDQDLSEIVSASLSHADESL